MRNISFSLTTDKVRKKEKDVTRRMGWLFAKVGDQLHGCKKCMGLRPDEPLVYLHDIEITSIRREPLHAMLADKAYGEKECVREGFPHMSPEEFILMFCASHKGCTVDSIITRIEFKYL